MDALAAKAHLLPNANDIQHPGVPQLGQDQVIHVHVWLLQLVGLQATHVPGSGGVQHIHQGYQLGAEGVCHSGTTLARFKKEGNVTVEQQTKCANV